MTEPAITPELVAKHNLTPEEYANIERLLGRAPSYTELGIFSVMWSEHCSYKNTRPLLKTFPTKSKKILVGAGEENAGIIDIGDGLAIAFKIESHNHPSAVEPFQGAATGVGGIVRDIFTMGARPICSVNSLRFGPITNGAGSEISNSKSEIANNRRLFAGVVAGIAHYGECSESITMYALLQYALPAPGGGVGNGIAGWSAFLTVPVGHARAPFISQCTKCNHDAVFYAMHTA